MKLGDIQVIGIENMPKDKMFLGKIIEINLELPEIIMKFEVVGTIENFVIDKNKEDK